MPLVLVSEEWLGAGRGLGSGSGALAVGPEGVVRGGATAEAGVAEMDEGRGGSARWGGLCPGGIGAAATGGGLTAFAGVTRYAKSAAALMVHPAATARAVRARLGRGCTRTRVLRGGREGTDVRAPSKAPWTRWGSTTGVRRPSGGSSFRKSSWSSACVSFWRRVERKSVSGREGVGVYLVD